MSAESSTIPTSAAGTSSPGRLSSPFIDPDRDAATAGTEESIQHAAPIAPDADQPLSVTSARPPTAPASPASLPHASPSRSRLYPPPSPTLEPTALQGFSRISSLESTANLGRAMSPPGTGFTSPLLAARQSHHRESPSRPVHFHPLSQSEHDESSPDQSGQLSPSPDHVAFADPSLMQLLGVMGSRLVEAEEQGLLQLNEDDSIDYMTMPEIEDMPDDEVHEEAAASPSTSPCLAQQGGDDQDTPQGGTPMAASLAGTEFKTIVARSSAGRQQEARLGGSPLAASFSIEAEGSSGSHDSPLRSPSSSAASLSDPGASIMSQSAASLHSLSALGASGAHTGPSRRDELLTKLRAIFSLDESEELRSCHPCWLFRNILLQGFLYVTTGHLLFYAYLPSKEERVLKAGTLRKRTQRTHRFSQHWAVLRGRFLTWYESHKDPYFPQAHIDLRDVSAVEPSDDAKHPTHFDVQTPHRRFTFAAASQQGRDSWVETLKKAVFRSQNQGESVRIAIPLESILDVDGSAERDAGTGPGIIAREAGEASASEIVCVKVLDGRSDDFAVDEYFFAHVSGHAELIETLKTEVAAQAAREAAGAAPKSGPGLKDSTSSLRTIRQALERTSTSSPVPVRSSIDAPRASFEAARSHTPPAVASSPIPLEGYPPSSVASLPPRGLGGAEDQSWKASVPGWLREAGERILANTPGVDVLGALAARPRRAVRETWSWRPGQQHGANLGGDLEGYGNMEMEDDLGPELAHDLRAESAAAAQQQSSAHTPREAEMLRQFRQTFALASDEALLADFRASLFRVLPVGGRIFLSERHMCFRSSRLVTSTMGRTLMILPISEIVSVDRNRAFRFNQHGAVITVKGHEELFFEFPAADERARCLALLEERLEVLQSEAERPAAPSDAAQRALEDKAEALILTDLGHRLDPSDSSGGAGADSSASAASSVHSSGNVSGAGGPGSEPLFRSTTSSFLSFKPQRKLHFTFLTIGSRGDVQPYIALGKGLQLEGHTVRIASHPEFRAWVEGHGIEFREVGGDPAELMRICVENGTFTVSFLREGVSKFRGWLDNLLVSAWDACQGTDVIIESPSAIAGIHVAEALEIPYFRAFTMPWSRTRAYPHAFAVPSSKAGGNYNYMSYVIFDQVFWRAMAGQVNRWRASCLGLQPTTVGRLDQHKVPFIYNFSPSLVPKPIDWYEWIHVTGFWFLDNPDATKSKEWTPPEDLVAFISSVRAQGRKLVYIGWGSIVVPDAVAVTRCVVEAVQRSGVCAILSKGWSDRLSSSTVASSQAPSLPHPDIFQVNSVPHDWLFPQIDAACHHGGAGTLGASLRAGLPTIVKPYFGDQWFWGQQVESLGVGSCVRNLTAERLSEVLVEATQNAKQIERARNLGQRIRSEDGVAAAIKAIYRDLDYATSLIKRGTKLPSASSFKADPSASADAAAEAHSSAQQPTAEEAETTERGRQGLGVSSSSIPSRPPLSRDVSVDSTTSSRMSDEWSVVSGSEEERDAAAATASLAA